MTSGPHPIICYNLMNTFIDGPDLETCSWWTKTIPTRIGQNLWLQTRRNKDIYNGLKTCMVPTQQHLSGTSQKVDKWRGIIIIHNKPTGFVFLAYTFSGPFRCVHSIFKGHEFFRQTIQHLHYGIRFWPIYLSFSNQQQFSSVGSQPGRCKAPTEAKA